MAFLHLNDVSHCLIKFSAVLWHDYGKINDLHTKEDALRFVHVTSIV